MGKVIDHAILSPLLHVEKPLMALQWLDPPIAAEEESVLLEDISDEVSLRRRSM